MNLPVSQKKVAVVPFSEFAGRKAEDIFSEVKRDGITLVSRDGETKCALMGPDAYAQMKEELEDAWLLAEAERRIAEGDGKGIPFEKILEENGITQADLDAVSEDDLEIE